MPPAPHGAQSSRRKTLVLLGKCAVAAALVGWLWQSGLLDFGQLLALRLDAALAGVVLAQVGVLAVPVVRWNMMLRARSLRFTKRQLVQIAMISYFGVLVLPAMGGQEAVRLYYASRIKPGRGPEILATLILDRFMGLVGLCLLGVGAGLVLLVNVASQPLKEIVGFAAVVLCVLLGILALLFRRRSRRWRGVLRRWNTVRLLIDALVAYRENRRVLVTAVGLSCLAHFCNCTAMYFGFVALGTELSLLASTALTPLVTLTSMIPATPMGLGVADAAAEGLFAVLGVTSGAEVTMLVRVVTAVLCVVCGVAYLAPLPRSDPEPADADPPSDRGNEPLTERSSAEEEPRTSSERVT